MFRHAILVASMFLALTGCGPAHAVTGLKLTDRGVVVETDRYRAEIRDGIVASFFNKLTAEEYLDPQFDMTGLLPTLPAGLGTQHSDEAFASAANLYHWPWRDFHQRLTLPNQHYPDAKSSFSASVSGDRSTVLTYTSLTDGTRRYDDETFRLSVSVEEKTSDLVIVASGKSPRPGVYAANVVVAAASPFVSIEAPIFDGVRLTADMPAALTINQWPSFWDYEMVALNGRKIGAVGIWAEDPKWRYKHLFYSTFDKQLALSLSTMNQPPFDLATEAEGVAWHFQAFDKSWSQAAARFRAWRQDNVPFAARPEWTRQVSFVNCGVNANKMWRDILSAYLEGQHLDRTVTFAPVIRARDFDTCHWDNKPYDRFAADMKAWKSSGAKLMAYLQPMIMWGNSDEPEAKRIIALARSADTIKIFQKTAKPLEYVDQHHLGHPGWQRWFLDWVRAYIQQYEADGVYHDQSYGTPEDSRGPINGMNSVQGMVDYFSKAATENPTAIHGTEHLQAANSVGASLGIGSGILWGDVSGMRWQRINHASPMSNALHYPHAALWAFPHFSDFARGDALQFHWGMDLMERRGDLAAMYLQSDFYTGKRVPFSQWVNELKLDRQRALLFVRHGLRPEFPEDFDRGVRSYFRGTSGEEFRYEDTAWGSRFVQVTDAQKKTYYGRIHGVNAAAAEGGVAGWIFYNEFGPSGLHPERYYVLDPALPRPAVYFQPDFEPMPGDRPMPSLHESFVENCCANDYFAVLKVQPIESIGGILGGDRVVLHCATKPALVLVNGQPAAAQAQPQGGYRIDFSTPAVICVLLRQPPPGVENLRTAALARVVSSINMDVIDSAAMTSRVTASTIKLPPADTGKAARVDAALPALATQAINFGGIRRYELHLPFKAPDGSGGILKLHTAADVDLWLNGQPHKSFEMPLKSGQMVLLSLVASQPIRVAFEWTASEENRKK